MEFKSTTAQLMTNLFRDAFAPGKEIPPKQLQRLAALDARVAHAQGMLDRSSNANFYLGRINTATQVLNERPDKNSYDYLSSIMPTAQDLRTRYSEQSVQLDQLKRTFNENFMQNPYGEILDAIAKGKSPTEIEVLIQRREKLLTDFEKGVVTHDRNAEALETRMHDFSRKISRETEHLTGQSLGEPVPETRVGPRG